MQTWKILLGLGLAVFFGLFILPQQREIAGLKTQLSQMETQQENTEKKFTALKEAEKTSQENPEKLLEQVPRKQEQEGVIRDLEVLADRNGFAVTQMTFSKRDDKDLRAGVISVNTVMEGNKNQMAKLLASIEANPRLMIVDTLNAKVSQGENVNSVALSMSINAYYQP